MADATVTVNPTTTPDVQPRIRPSRIFNAADADVLIRSCDNVEFRLHKKNLEFLSGGFPPADTETDPNEIIQLTESGETLELLFQFMYPQRFPSLTDFKIGPLTALAEAAEKYEVYALIHICELHLRSFMRQHPRKILEFAARHDHLELIQEIAPIMVPYLPLSELSTMLTPHLYTPWSVYRECWLQEAITTIAHTHPHNCYENLDKMRWGTTVLPLTLHQSLLLAPFNHNAPKYWESLASQYENRACCVSMIESVKAQIGRIVNKIPPLQLPAARDAEK
ncbi:hypothetical protein DFJ43DRAFT_693086 [Lentinula guzmanii]|uniref:BTB domain-containing protein n=1 Tax=Lentinula guzmanii TaxID=2804957 RepID=A0AA38N3J2_9AGAR|nr:hypothetical protein DFJ43DRAFT_693086 [Lentinula guzmanii]